MKPKLIFLIGPTAVGKSEAAVNLARKINAEIISCDSMQIYKTMDIISSKPIAALRKKIPHHLINIVPPTKEYNVSRFRRDAIRKIKDIIKRRKTPFFVGGSGLYMSVLIDGIFNLKTQDKGRRQRLYQEAAERGSGYLYERLKRVDPEAAEKIHPNDTKRIVRALEVFESSGKPISCLQKQRKGLADKYEMKIFCLNMPRDKLYQRIDERVDKMFVRGLLKEVNKLLKLKLSMTASYAIGIKELKGYFDGLYDLEKAKALMKRNTRWYAKRQLTWFRKDNRISWVELGVTESPSSVANRLLERLRIND